MVVHGRWKKTWTQLLLRVSLIYICVAETTIQDLPIRECSTIKLITEESHYQNCIVTFQITILAPETADILFTDCTFQYSGIDQPTNITINIISAKHVKFESCHINFNNIPIQSNVNMTFNNTNIEFNNDKLYSFASITMLNTKYRYNFERIHTFQEVRVANNSRFTLNQNGVFLFDSFSTGEMTPFTHQVSDSTFLGNGIVFDIHNVTSQLKVASSVFDSNLAVFCTTGPAIFSADIHFTNCQIFRIIINTEALGVKAFSIGYLKRGELENNRLTFESCNVTANLVVFDQTGDFIPSLINEDLMWIIDSYFDQVTIATNEMSTLTISNSTFVNQNYFMVEDSRVFIDTSQFFCVFLPFQISGFSDITFSFSNITFIDAQQDIGDIDNIYIGTNILANSITFNNTHFLGKDSDNYFLILCMAQIANIYQSTFRYCTIEFNSGSIIKAPELRISGSKFTDSNLTLFQDMFLDPFEYVYSVFVDQSQFERTKVLLLNTKYSEITNSELMNGDLRLVCYLDTCMAKLGSLRITRINVSAQHSLELLDSKVEYSNLDNSRFDTTISDTRIENVDFFHSNLRIGTKMSASLFYSNLNNSKLVGDGSERIQVRNSMIDAESSISLDSTQGLIFIGDSVCGGNCTINCGGTSLDSGDEVYMDENHYTTTKNCKVIDRLPNLLPDERTISRTICTSFVYQFNWTTETGQMTLNLTSSQADVNVTLYDCISNTVFNHTLVPSNGSSSFFYIAQNSTLFNHFVPNLLTCVNFSLVNSSGPTQVTFTYDMVPAYVSLSRSTVDIVGLPVMTSLQDAIFNYYLYDQWGTPVKPKDPIPILLDNSYQLEIDQSQTNLFQISLPPSSQYYPLIWYKLKLGDQENSPEYLFFVISIWYLIGFAVSMVVGFLAYRLYKSYKENSRKNEIIKELGIKATNFESYIRNWIPVHGDSFYALLYKTPVPAIEIIVTESLKHITELRSNLICDDIFLTDEELLVIVMYTYEIQFNSLKKFTEKDNLYYRLNQALATRDITKIEDWIPYLHYMFSALDKLENKVCTVYRGVPNVSLDFLEANYRKTTTIHWSRFSSATVSFDTAKGFAGSRGVVFIIAVTTGKDIQPFSCLQLEKEILLPPNMNFVVEEAPHYQNGVLTVGLRQQTDDYTF